jgi:hypothetical protein
LKKKKKRKEKAGIKKGEKVGRSEGEMRGEEKRGKEDLFPLKLTIAIFFYLLCLAIWPDDVEAVQSPNALRPNKVDLWV